ncbi:MAG: class I SAM-dependent methyltransferase [Candidatus Saccharicenans sp.]|nr:MAG: methyltransferase type 11 [Candidatus Aminicenantes bacterium]HEK86410.1 class I SAM-dependent methyltransferase [Candidatus Aminicenantes bacterium]
MVEKRKKLYPKSKVELSSVIARHYDRLLDLGSLGLYGGFLKRAIKDIGLKPTDHILDLGCGTGRNAALMMKYLGPSGKIVGLDLLPEMKEQFEKKFEKEPRAIFRHQRIDVPFDLGEKYDLAFMSFVLHGFPQEVRMVILNNIKRHLKPGGQLVILDYAEFDLDKKPLLFRLIFKKFECSYALEFIILNWKKVLAEQGFRFISEKFYARNYVRLLKVQTQDFPLENP